MRHTERNTMISRMSTWLSIQASQTRAVGTQGTEDEVIDAVHGRRLHSLARHPSEPLWAEGHNHQVCRSTCESPLLPQRVHIACTAQRCCGLLGCMFTCAVCCSQVPVPPPSAATMFRSCPYHTSLQLHFVAPTFVPPAGSGNGGQVLADAEALHEGGMARVQRPAVTQRPLAAAPPRHQLSAAVSFQSGGAGAGQTIASATPRR